MRMKGIAFKTFIFTAGLLTITSLLIYLALYFIMPEFYYNSKKAVIENNAITLVKELKGQRIGDISLILNQYAAKYNVGVIILDEKGNPIYSPPPMLIMSPGNKGIPLPQYPVKIELKLNDGKSRNFTGLLEARKTVTLSGKVYQIVIPSPLQPINEAANVILKMFPFMVLAILIISAIGALIYSRIITKPILFISEVAGKMSRMEKDAHATYPARDEIGLLSDNLNIMYQNLYKAIESLKETNEKLAVEMQYGKELERLKNDFMTAVSHELKTPIAAVSGILEGMLDNIGIYKDREKYLRECRKLMNNLSNLINEVLELSSFERQDFKVQISKLNLGELIHQVLEPYLLMAQTKGINIELIGTFDYMVHADARLLGKALSNVISNALKNTLFGRRMVIRTMLKNERLSLFIENEGEPINEKHIKDVFEPFFRGDSSRSRTTGGSGLGLYIVRKNLEACGIGYEISNIRGGVSFVFIFEFQE